MSYERDAIRRMVGYAYGEQPQGGTFIKLNTNENPYPPSPAVAKALARFDASVLRRYPPATADPLRSLIAERAGLRQEQVVVTNGGDEGLRLAVTTFVDAGATFGMAEPGYSLYPVLASVQECIVETVPLTSDWQPPADFAGRMNDAGAKLTCLVNPHAPSGALMDATTVAALAGRLDGVLLVDEAYVDFVDPQLRHDLVPLLARHDNLLLLRTFSKGYSLAGLRVGYLLGAADLVEPMLGKTRDSFNVDAIAQSLAAAAFEDTAYASECWRRVREQRRRLTAELRDLGFEVPDSQTNFVLAQAPKDAAGLHQALRRQDVLVRHFDTPRLADRLRITVGTAAENDALLEALARIATAPAHLPRQ